MEHPDPIVEAATIGLGEAWLATPRELASYRDWIVRHAPVVEAARIQESEADEMGKGYMRENLVIGWSEEGRNWFEATDKLEQAVRAASRAKEAGDGE